MVIQGSNVNRLNRIQNNTNPPARQKQVAEKGDFASILKESIQQKEPVTFSKHAAQRMKERNIQFVPAQMAKLAEAVEKADKKGVKDTLVILGDAALVVNVHSKTVITATASKELKENVFTNIDGAVILE